jgi:hypothetical protein
MLLNYQLGAAIIQDGCPIDRLLQQETEQGTIKLNDYYREGATSDSSHSK